MQGRTLFSKKGWLMENLQNLAWILHLSISEIKSEVEMFLGI